MTLQEWGKFKYPNVTDPELLQTLAALERFNPDLPGMVDKGERPETYHHYKHKMKRIASKLRGKE